MDLPPDSPFKQPIETIHESGKKAAAIVEDLLTLARRGVAVAEIVNLNDIISQYLASPEFDKLSTFHPRVKIKTNFDPGLLNIRGSSVHLSKTIMNLVSNAAEAMPDGGSLHISTQNQYIDRPVKGYAEVQEGDYAVIDIRDTGIGIPPEDLQDFSFLQMLKKLRYVFLQEDDQTVLVNLIKPSNYLMISPSYFM